MIKLTVIGGIYGTSGYASHTRGLIKALSKHFDVKLNTALPPQWEILTTDLELQMIRKADSADRINVIIDMPFNWLQYANKKHNIGFLVWEGDTIPRSWKDIILDTRISQVWVPSTHVYNAIKNTFELTGNLWPAVKFKIKIVPHGFDPEIFYPKEQQPRQFTFLVNKGFRGELDRGGMQHAIKAYIEEFNNLDNTVLMLKLNTAYAIPPELLHQYIAHIVQQSGKTLQQCAAIHFIYDSLSPSQLCDLYNRCDVLLNPTEAEAFSLPCIEAMACGKPVITTNYGGQTDFVTNASGWLIDYQLHEVKHDILYEGIKWALPDITQLKKIMREAYIDSQKTKRKGELALNGCKDWTWNNSALKALQSLQELGVTGDASRI